jgi:N-methyl-L-proline demethylase
VLAGEPQVVIVATGGLPNTGIVEQGQELVVSSWDIMAGHAKPGEEVLLYDDNGAHPGLQAAEALAEAGARVEIVTPERFFAPEIGGLNHVAYARCFQEHGVRITINTRLVAVRREGNRLAAVLGSDYGELAQERLVDQVVVEHGTLPLDDLYFALKPGSSNRGEVDHRALLANSHQTLMRNPDGRYQLFRVGDAVASRNIHAAIYDSLRLCSVL